MTQNFSENSPALERALKNLEQAAAAENEITEMIDRIMEKKGKLYLPIVGAPYFHKASRREILLNAKNVKEFVDEQKIDDFTVLDTYAKEQEKSKKETDRIYLSKSEKLLRLKELSSAYAAYQPYMEVRKKYRSLIPAVIFISFALTWISSHVQDGSSLTR